MRATTDRTAGFSLIELLVAMLLVSLVLGGAMAMFNYTSRLTRRQLHQADLQQAARVSQRELLGIVRMAGRGGLSGFNVVNPTVDQPGAGPASFTPALEVRNNVPSGSNIGDAMSPEVLEGTDVLTIRGHLTSAPIFVNYTDPATYAPDPGNNGGVITISSRSPAGIPQDLGPIVDAVNNNQPEALIITSALTDLIYGVAELDVANSMVGGYDPDPTNITSIQIAYRYTGGTHADAYALLSAGGVFPDTNVPHPAWLPPRGLQNVGSIGLLEEYRYFIEDPDDDIAPRLAIGRFFPATDAVHPGGGLGQPLADNVYDLQVALGFDSSFDGGSAFNGFFDRLDDDDPLGGNDDIIVDGDLLAGADTATDDWLFNDEDDEDALTALPWSPAPAAGGIPPTFSTAQPRPRLYYARVTTLSMSARGEPGYQAPLIDAIEDHDYTGSEVESVEGRRFHRLQLTTIIDMRNL